METQKAKSNTYLLLCLTCFLIAMISGYKGISYIISAGFGFLLMLELRSMNKRHISLNKSWKFFMGFFVFYTVTSLINFVASNYIIYMLIYFLTFLPLLISQNMIECATETTMKNALKCCFAVFMFFSVISIYYYFKNPGLARDMASHQVEGKLAIGGGYSLAYAVAIIGVYIFSKIINKRIKPRLTSFVVILLCLYLVFLTESMITLLAMLAGLFIAILTVNDESGTFTLRDTIKYLFIFLFLGITVLVVVSKRYEIAEWVLNQTSITDENVLNKRVAEIVNELVYGESTYHVDVRYATLENSVEVFLENPLIGVGHKYGYLFDVGKHEYMVGNHSEILDAFAKYGIVGAILWLQPFFSTLKVLGVKNLGCVVTIFIMMCLNPFSVFQTAIVLFFFIPITEELLKRKDAVK